MDNAWLEIIAVVASGVIGGAGFQAVMKAWASRQSAVSNVIQERADAQDSVNRAHNTMLADMQARMQQMASEISVIRRENKKLMEQNVDMRITIVRLQETIRTLQRDIRERDKIINELRRMSHTNKQNIRPLTKAHNNE